MIKVHGTRGCARGPALLLLLACAELLCPAGKASEILPSSSAVSAAAETMSAPAVADTVVITVATEQEAQAAIDRHTTSSILLHVVLRPVRSRSNSGSTIVRLTSGVIVRKGTGPIIFSSDDSSSSSGAQLTVDCSSLASSATAAIKIETQSAVDIRGFHITGCNNTLAVEAINSGAVTLLRMKFTKNSNTKARRRQDAYGTVSCEGCNKLTVTDSTFFANTARVGGAINVRGSSEGLQLVNSTFLDNVGVSDAGSINIVTSLAHIAGCSFKNEKAITAGSWGGSINYSGAGLMLEDSSFSGCSSMSHAGAIAMFNATAELRNVTCNSTVADVSGGCFFAGFANVTVWDSVFYNNTSWFVGGVFSLDRTANLTAYNTTFTSNHAYYGGVINGQEEFGSTVLHGCMLANNTATEKGGALHMETQTFRFLATDSVFIDNKVDKLGGAVACTTAPCRLVNCTLRNNTADELGGALWSSAAPLLELTDTKIAENKAQRGGAVYAEKAEIVSVTGSNIFSNTAEIDGGGLTVLSARNATMASTTVQHNKAVVGAGIMLLATGLLQMTNSTIAHNVAAKAGGQAVVVTTDGTVANAGSGAGMWGIQSDLDLVGVVLKSNQAERDGAGAYLLACTIAISNSSLASNTAQTGNGGALYANVEAGLATSVTGTTFASNTASSGGAVFVTGPTAGSGYGSLSCNECRLLGNKALAQAPTTAGGGGIMATGNVRAQFISSQATNNTAECGSGGAIQCLHCTVLHVEGSAADSNSAGRSGGAISCMQCGSAYFARFAAGNNTAAAGGALSLSICGQNGSDITDPGSLEPSGIYDSTFTSNSAQARVGYCTSGGVSSSGQDRSTAIAEVAATSGIALKSGGAVIVENWVPFTIRGSSFERNSADGDGGAVYHRACQDAGGCTLDMHDTSFTENTAPQGGGGAMFTTNGSSLVLGNTADCQNDGNKWHCAGSGISSSSNAALYGPDFTTSPASLAFTTSNIQNLQEVAGTSTQPVPVSLQAFVGEGSRSGAETVLYLSSNKEFNLTVTLLDLFGKQVQAGGTTQLADASLRLADFTTTAATALKNSSSSSACSQPGVRTNGVSNSSSEGGTGSSLCAVAGWPTEQQQELTASVCPVGCLTGATTVAFDQGYANFTNLGLSAAPNSLLYMDIVPRGLDGITVTRVLIRVQPCGVGEVLRDATNQEASCEACPVPLINLSPSLSNSCGECPLGADCLSGFMVPQPGFWHSHPRSANFLPCTSKRACAAADPGKLVAYQRVLKYQQHPEESVIAFKQYMQAQCAETRDGPLCSSCAPGYGLGPGNVCHRCSSSNRIAVLVAFLAVRLLDAALVFSLAVVMMFIRHHSVRCTPCPESNTTDQFSGQLQINAAAAAAATSAPAAAAATKGIGVPDHVVERGDSATDTAKDDAKAATADERSVKTCAAEAAVSKGLVQLSLAIAVLLEWQQIGYLLFNTASPFMPGGVSWLALLFLTPSSTLHWVPLGCVMPGTESTAAAALSILYPMLLCGAVGLVLLCIKRQCRSAPKTLDPIVEQHTPYHTITGMPALHVIRAACASAVDELGTSGLLVVAAAASLLYCVADVSSAMASAFQCSALDPALPTDGTGLPGDTRAATGFWWSRDLRLPCFSEMHTAAAVLAGLIGIPLVLGTVALVLFAVKQNAAAEERVATGRAQWHRIQRMREDSAFSVSRSLLRLLSSKSAEKAPDVQVSAAVQSRKEVAAAAASGVQAALDMVGLMMRLPFSSFADWWCGISTVWRVLLASCTAVLGTAVGSNSVLMVGLAASALVAMLQLMHVACLPGSKVINADTTLAASYVGLQVMCLLLVSADAFTSTYAASAALYTFTAMLGSGMTLYQLYLAISAFTRCLPKGSSSSTIQLQQTR